MTKKKVNFIVIILLLFVPFVFQFTSVSAVGIDGVDITTNGEIKVDNAQVNLPDSEETGVGDTLREQFNELLDENKWIASFFTGIATLIIGGIWIYKVFQFAKSGADSSARKKAMSSLISLGIATALLLGSTFFISFSTGLFNF